MSAPGRSFGTDKKGIEEWEPVRRKGAFTLKRLIRKSLEKRGRAKVRTRVKRNGKLDYRVWTLTALRCVHDDELYPFECTYKRSESKAAR